jgi:hypothetical protein
MDRVAECAQQRKHITATATIAGQGALLGFFVSQSSSGTIEVEDAGGTIASEFSVEASRYYPLPVAYTGGLTVTITGTAEVTVLFNAG